MKFNATSIRNLVLPADVSEKTFFDDTLAGFGVRVRASGAKSFVVQYKIHGKNRRMPLGPVDVSRPRQGARARQGRPGRCAASARTQPARRSSNDRRSPARSALLLPRFLDRQRSRLKPRSLVETERHLAVHAKPLHGLAVEAIDRRTIAVLLGGIAEKSGPFAANRTRASRQAFSPGSSARGSSRPIRFWRLMRRSRARPAPASLPTTSWRQYGTPRKMPILMARSSAC